MQWALANYIYIINKYYNLDDKHANYDKHLADQGESTEHCLVEEEQSYSDYRVHLHVRSLRSLNEHFNTYMYHYKKKYPLARECTREET